MSNDVTKNEQNNGQRQWVIIGTTAKKIYDLYGVAFERGKESFSSDRVKRATAELALLDARDALHAAIKKAIGVAVLSFTLDADKFGSTQSVFVTEDAPTPKAVADGKRFSIGGEPAFEIARLALQESELNDKIQRLKAEAKLAGARMWALVEAEIGEADVCLALEPARFEDTGTVTAYQIQHKSAGAGLAAFLAKL